MLGLGRTLLTIDAQDICLIGLFVTEINLVYFILSIADAANTSCYLHNISPLKTAGTSKRKYFNLIVQCKDRPVRAVCYSPEKRAELHALASTKSPVKLNNYKQPSNGDDDFVITKFTKITPLDKNEIDFPFSEELTATATGKPLNISLIHKLAAEQLICVKAKVVSLSGVKVLSTRYGPLKKQDVIIADPTAYIKIVLWGDYVGTLNLNQTYALNNVKVKVTKYEHYLNTPRNEEMKATEVAPYDVPIVDYEDEVGTTSTINGTIQGVHEVSKHLCCTSCQKRTVDVTAPDRARCQSCHLIQLPTTCNASWALRVLVKPESSPKNLHLRMDNNAAQLLVPLLSPAIQLASATENDIISLLLRSRDKVLTLTYDTLTYQVSEVLLK